MVKYKRGFIFNLHVGSIIRPLLSAGFEWESGLFVTASQPVWHLVACSQLRQELSLSCSLCLPVSLSLCRVHAMQHTWLVSGQWHHFSHASMNRFTPILLRGGVFCFVFLSLLLCHSLHHKWGSNWAKPFWYVVTQKFFLKALLSSWLYMSQHRQLLAAVNK